MSSEKNLPNKNFKDLSEYQVNEPVYLEKLNCSYHDFISWLKNYPETTGKYRNTIKLKFKELSSFEIFWSMIIDSPGYETIDFPIFDGFSFDVVEIEPLTLRGYYSYFDIKKPRNEIYSKHAKEFIELVNLHFKPSESKERAGNYSSIDDLCLKWVNRDVLDGNMTNFLSEYSKESGNFISKKQFQSALRDAFERGIIGKNKRGRFIPI